MVPAGSADSEVQYSNVQNGSVSMSNPLCSIAAAGTQEALKQANENVKRDCLLYFAIV